MFHHHLENCGLKIKTDQLYLTKHIATLSYFRCCSASLHGHLMQLLEFVDGFA